jgi:hypothetical protein
MGIARIPFPLIVYGIGPFIYICIHIYIILMGIASIPHSLGNRFLFVYIYIIIMGSQVFLYIL